MNYLDVNRKKYVLKQRKSKENLNFPCFSSSGEPPEIRTPDPLIKSQMLCQLS